jgi:hypothetical protein
MYSRVTLLEIDTLRMDVDDAVAEYQTRFLPHLRELPGYEGVAVMVTPEGKGMVVTFWDSEETVEASSAFAASIVDEFLTLYRSPPGREHYRVAYAEMPRVTVES